MVWHRETAEGGAVRPKGWTNSRRVNRALTLNAGELGRVEHAAQGDIMLLEFAPGRCWYVRIAWRWASGGVMTHLWNARAQRFPTTSRFLKGATDEQRCRWILLMEG